MSCISSTLKSWQENQDNDLAEIRLQICNDCPLCVQKDENGPYCDSRRFINHKNEVATRWLPGFKRGCGCYLKYKVPHQHNKCVIGKW